MGVQDPEHLTASAADRVGDAVDVGHDLARLINAGEGDAGQHEAVLQVDDDQRGLRRIEIRVGMGRAPPLGDAIGDVLRNIDLVHEGSRICPDAMLPPIAAAVTPPRHSM